MQKKSSMVNTLSAFIEWWDPTGAFELYKGKAGSHLLEIFIGRSVHHESWWHLLGFPKEVFMLVAEPLSAQVRCLPRLLPVRSTRKGAQAQSPKQGLEGKEVMSQGGRAGKRGKWHGEGQPPSPRRLCFETHPLSGLRSVLGSSPHPDPAQATVQLSGGAQASAFF